MSLGKQPAASFISLALFLTSCLLVPAAASCGPRADSGSSAAGARGGRVSRPADNDGGDVQKVANREKARPGGREARDAGKGQPDVRAVEDLIVRQTNDFRRSEAREAVKTNDRLLATAREFAGFMARTGEYGHTADGRQPWDRAAAHGYAYCIALENIAYQYNSEGFETGELAGGFVQGWKDSPGHRRNMLDPDVTETGVAVARSPETGYYYAVQMFGRPKSAAIRFEVMNRAGRSVRYTLEDEAFELPPRYSRVHTRCRPGELRVEGAGGGGMAPLRPADGDAYVIEGGAGGIEVKTQRR
jgi:uncharacterized protein YkwD